MKILVLMSTYNGEKYIKEQVESILHQNDVKVFLLVRDDGSKDNTKQLIEQLQAEYPSQMRFVEGENKGCVGSFYELAQVALVEYSDYDYYAFSDQDDVWCSDKLKSALTALENENKEIPQLYGCSFKKVDAKLQAMAQPSLPNYANSMAEACVINMILGCTMVFNKSLLQLFLKANPSQITSLHDEWMYKVCLAVGGVVKYDRTPHILYRQHGNNVVGANKSRLSVWKARWKHFTEASKKRSTTLSRIWDVYYEDITEENRSIIGLLINDVCFITRLKVLFSSKYNTSSLQTNMLFKIAFLTNRY